MKTKLSPENLLQLSYAKARNHLGFKYSKKQLFIAIWKNLWNTVGLYYRGLTRIPVWLSVQFNLLRKSIKCLSEKKENWVLHARLLKETKFHLSEAHFRFQFIQDNPLVSIIMPIWNRAEVVTSAVTSVLNQIYTNWELIIVDDGSIDDTKATLKEMLTDTRIIYYYQPHRGVCAARNLGIEKSKGTFIAYLDSDNTWLPHYLLIMVNALLKDPTLQGIYSALLMYSAANKNSVYYPETLNYDEAILHQKDNSFCGIDINTFMHRRELINQLGGFDTSLTRLTDYELTFRYLLHANIKSLPILGAKYYYCLTKNAISRLESVWYNIFLIREKYANLSRQTTPLRVLYLLYEPSVQLQVELDYLQRKNIQVKVWRGQSNLKECLQSFCPHVVHTHEFSQALEYADLVHHQQLQLTVQLTNKITEQFICKLYAHPAIAKIYIAKQLYHEHDHLSKTQPLMPCFNPKLYFPSKNKQRRLVIEVLAHPRQLHEIDTFIRIALKCTDHKFILILPSHMQSTYTKLVSLNEKYNQPVHLHIIDHENEMVKLINQAEIYLDTASAQAESALSLSVYKAMATGSCIITQRHDLVDGMNEKNFVYATEAEAVKLIKNTLTWPDETRDEIKRMFIDQAYQWFVDERVLSTVVDDWHAIQSKTSYLTQH